MILAGQKLHCNLFQRDHFTKRYHWLMITCQKIGMAFSEPTMVSHAKCVTRIKCCKFVWGVDQLFIQGFISTSDQEAIVEHYDRNMHHYVNLTTRQSSLMPSSGLPTGQGLSVTRVVSPLKADISSVKVLPDSVRKIIPGVTVVTHVEVCTVSTIPVSQGTICG